MTQERFPGLITRSVCNWIVCSLGCLFVVLFGFSAHAQESVTVIRGGTLIDGNGGAPRQNVSMVIAGNRIKSISPGAPDNVPAGATVIDAAGKYIVPGLWDTHIHYHNWFPELLITNGVTSTLQYSSGAWIQAQAEGTAKGKILGPRFFQSKEHIGDFYMIEDKEMVASKLAKGREDAIKQVRELAAEGANIVKVYTSVTPDILEAVTTEAHRHGLSVSGHIGMRASLAAKNGIDNLAHSTGIDVDLLKPDDLAKIPDMRVIDSGRLRVEYPKIGRPWDKTTERWGPNPDLTEYPLFIEDPRRLEILGMMDQGLARNLIKLLVSKHVMIESCLGYIFRNVHDRVPEYRAEDQKLLDDPNLQYVPERYKMNILDYSIVDKFHPDELALMKKGYKNYQWFIKTFIEAGGKVSTGMDTASSYHATMMPGLSVRREMQMLVDAGVPPMQAIQAATKWAAELLRQTKDLGTLEPGKLADLLVLSRDPIADIGAFKDIEVVMKDGQVQPRGYHADFKNPIPENPATQMNFEDWVVSEIPTQIRGVSPGAVVEGSDGITLTVKGKDFISTSMVQFADTVLPTEFVDSTQLKAKLPAEMLKQVGTYTIRVVHRAPGWGKTNPANFIVKFK
jgi:hypothetical protein